MLPCRWTQAEKDDNDDCRESVTLIDEDGEKHCFEKDSEEEAVVKCIEDDDKEGAGKYIFQSMPVETVFSSSSPCSI